MERLLMTLDDEIRKEISLLPEQPEIVDDWEHIADELSDSYSWAGSKIDWSKTSAHRSLELHGDYKDWLVDIKKFIHETDVHDVISNSDEIYYINDSSLDFSFRLNPAQFFLFFDVAIENIPQHHYFFDRENKWCLVISAEGYIDFGFSCLDKK